MVVLLFTIFYSWSYQYFISPPQSSWRRHANTSGILFYLTVQPFALTTTHLATLFAFLLCAFAKLPYITKVIVISPFLLVLHVKCLGKSWRILDWSNWLKCQLIALIKLWYFLSFPYLVLCLCWKLDTLKCVPFRSFHLLNFFSQIHILKQRCLSSYYPNTPLGPYYHKLQ